MEDSIISGIMISSTNSGGIKVINKPLSIPLHSVQDGSRYNKSKSVKSIDYWNMYCVWSVSTPFVPSKIYVLYSVDIENCVSKIKFSLLSSLSAFCIAAFQNQNTATSFFNQMHNIITLFSLECVITKLNYLIGASFVGRFCQSIS